MRKIISILLALSLMLVPVLGSCATELYYGWLDDSMLELYDLGFNITMADGWVRAEDEVINAMNGLTPEGEPDPAVTADSESSTALNPTVLAQFANGDGSVVTTITAEYMEDTEYCDTPDKYLQLFANDIVASGIADVTYTYDPATIGDAVLSLQSFRELAVVGSDGSIIDLLVCHSGIGAFYTIMIQGTNESIGAFALDFVNSIAEIESVG